MYHLINYLTTGQGGTTTDLTNPEYMNVEPRLQPPVSSISQHILKSEESIWYMPRFHIFFQINSMAYQLCRIFDGFVSFAGPHPTFSQFIHDHEDKFELVYFSSKK